MAISLFKLQLHTLLSCSQNEPISTFIPKIPPFIVNGKNPFPCPIAAPKIRYKLSYSAPVSKLSVLNIPTDGGDEAADKDAEFSDILRSWANHTRSVFSGGSWWNLPNLDGAVDGVAIAAEPVTVLQALRRMWALVANDRWVVYIAFGALTVAALSEISMPSLLAASIFSAQRGETVVFIRNSRLLVLLCFMSGISSGLRSCCFGIANTMLVKHLRERLFSALLYQDIYFFDRETVGDLTSRLGADCQRLSHVLENNVHLISRNILQGTGAMMNLLILSWPLALSAIIICLVLSVVFLVYGRYQKKAAKFIQEFTAHSNEVAQEAFSLIRTVRAYGTEKKEKERYKLWLDRLAFVGLRESVAYGLWNLSFSTLYRSTQVFAILLGGISILTTNVSAEQLTKYVLYCEWLIYAAWRVQDNMSSLLQSVGACEKVLHLMDLLPCDQLVSDGVRLQKLMGNIEFVNVSFHYPSRITVPILDNVNFYVQANEVIALVGVSGSGKSTLINLILRLYEPSSGQILIDGLPLKELDIRWLRGKIGYVEQEPHLFRMDIKSNISCGCSRDIRQEDIEFAAKQAFAHEFISSLPDGYGTIIHNDLLSGGQKQRIAIARAILRDPAILILDEATSALDAESEYYMKGVIHAITNDSRAKRTVIIIAHRLSTIKAANRIMVMDGGQIVEEGDYSELLHKDGLFAHLVKLEGSALA